MARIACRAVIPLLIAALALAPVPAALAQEAGESEERSAGAMTFDLLLIRPVGVVATVLGSALFIASVPFAAAGGNTMPAYEKMVIQPAKFTFQRPLGFF
jgi:hypothetical protein